MEMSDSEPINKRSIILWSIGLSILIVALTAVTFILIFPGNPGFTLDEFPKQGNHCLTDLESYVEIQNPKADRGWIHYGNATDIMNHLDTYCNSEFDIDVSKDKSYDFGKFLEI